MTLCKFNSVKIKNKVHTTVCNNMVTIFLMMMQYILFSLNIKKKKDEEPLFPIQV